MNVEVKDVRVTMETSPGEMPDRVLIQVRMVATDGRRGMEMTVIGTIDGLGLEMEVRLEDVEMTGEPAGSVVNAALVLSNLLSRAAEEMEEAVNSRMPELKEGVACLT